jgi:hypothetical protein
VVAEHYRSVSLGSVRTELVPEDRLAYVSYRIGNKIYWTKNKVHLKKGEMILTDGLTQVRARCGNCISMQPMAPTSEAEPDAVQTDALMAPGAQVPLAPPASTGIGAGTILAAELSAGPEGFLGPFNGVGPSFGGALPLGGSGGSGSGGPGPSGPSGNEPSLPGLIPPIVVPGNPPGGGGTPPEFTPPEDPLPPLIVDVPPEIDVQPPPADPAPVPEPGTMLLVTGGLATMLARRRNS